MATVPAAPGRRRLFVAIRPSAEVSDALAALSRSLVAGVGAAVRRSPPEGYHVTLRYIGETAIEPVVEALDRMLPMEATMVQLGPDLFELGSAIVVTVTGADSLAERIAVALAGIGPAQPDRPFLGHLTIARWRRGQHLEGAIDRAFEGRFIATTVELLASRPDPASDGPRYETLRSWPLTSR